MDSDYYDGYLYCLAYYNTSFENINQLEIFRTGSSFAENVFIDSILLDPAADVLRGPYHIEILDHYLISCIEGADSGSVAIYDLTDPEIPILVGNIKTVGGRAFGISQEYAIVGGFGEAQIIDLDKNRTYISSGNQWIPVIGDSPILGLSGVSNINGVGGSIDGLPFDIAISKNIAVIGGQDFLLAIKVSY
jgi:hypothetical protein